MLFHLNISFFQDICQPLRQVCDPRKTQNQCSGMTRRSRDLLRPISTYERMVTLVSILFLLCDQDHAKRLYKYCIVTYNTILY
jgi:hypothetical protein